ncbi:MAG: CTP synthase [Chitinophagaceae bacterium]
MNHTKYIFVLGGVTSSLGKGIIAASLAKLLQARGLKVTLQKFDPYINIDPGTLNPYEHGECYVTDDGAETDLDLGHYERFLNIPTSQANNVTTGRVYQTVIDRERKGDYRGKTVQVVPHITDEIKRRFCMLESEKKYDIIITEIGGTVGDIESLPFIESIRQLQWELPENDCVIIHLTLIPFLNAAKELKTKPTQHSVRTLQQNGLLPDIIVCRTEHSLDNDIKRKIALFCNVQPDAVIEAIDAKSIYSVPLAMMKEKLDKIVLKKLNIINNKNPNLEKWNNFLDKLFHPKKEIHIGLIGKYVELQDAYKSILEAFIHAGTTNECKVNVYPIQSKLLTPENIDKEIKCLHKVKTILLKNLDGLLIAPGFGERGMEGKISAIQFARMHKIPFLGICLGMQMCVVEFARNVLGYKEAMTTEANPNTQYPVIDMMANQKEQVIKGGTMRLGAYQCELKENSLAYQIYKQSFISERHRHRYELNNKYLRELEKNGLLISGKNPTTELAEIVEIKDHPFFIATQFHPELKSTVENPHPLFVAFVKACLEYQKRKI